MTKILLSYCLFLAVLLSGCSTPKTAGSAAAPSVKLFNGKNLDGWYTFIEKRGKDMDVKNVFTVDKGLIRISGEEYGCIITNQEYSNYKLVVEYKWGTKTYAPRADNARDNGILLHSNGKDGGYEGIWMHSIECQIIEGGTGDLLVVGDGSKNFSATSTLAPRKPGGGRVFLPGGKPTTINGGRVDWFARDPAWKDSKGFRGANDIEKAEKWNRLECIAEGDKLSYLLNGVLVNQAYDVKPSKGRIQIQSEGAEMFVRKVEITPLAVDK